MLCLLATGAAAEDGSDVPYKVDSMLTQKYGEARLVTLRGRVDRVVWLSHDGSTWTIVRHDSDDVACIESSGGKWSYPDVVEALSK